MRNAIQTTLAVALAYGILLGTSSTVTADDGPFREGGGGGALGFTTYRADAR